ncbi:hypothetical protein EGW08_009445 [Elysia chlorotica]|uniref:Uncharacterized protein n=1 Tax=Elysia chlorotica TaxID=188477 RepID=A0A433TMM7_ELYCH|nr:hypothetical protein EGW08_009445 [Elysia chlorotica]
MAPKKAKKKDEPEHETEAEVPPEADREQSPYDPYKELKYVASPCKPQTKKKMKITKIPVLKPRLVLSDTAYVPIPLTPLQTSRAQQDTHGSHTKGFSQTTIGSFIVGSRDKADTWASPSKPQTKKKMKITKIPVLKPRLVLSDTAYVPIPLTPLQTSRAQQDTHGSHTKGFSQTTIGSFIVGSERQSRCHIETEQKYQDSSCLSRSPNSAN